MISISVSLDHSKGFGGKYGVQSDHMDKVLTVVSNCIFSSNYIYLANILSWLLCLQAAVGWDYEGKTEEHASQKGEF